ncbi:MAG: fluoride efflux transporter CrcB [Bacteroidales bacterium]|nr:fluoride efflux transporter CrcB [Bacteroidales bacterium]
MVKELMLIAAGGALGSIGRYSLSLLASQLLIGAEWATLAANVAGSFLIGLAMPGASSQAALFYTVGLCGGFTTFSTFSSQSLHLLHDGRYLAAVLYMSGTMVLSLAMVALGWYCRQRIWK